MTVQQADGSFYSIWGGVEQLDASLIVKGVVAVRQEKA